MQNMSRPSQGGRLRSSTARIGLGLALTGMIAFPAWAGGDAGRGKAVTEKFGCSSCHGADFSTPTDAAYPRLAGQHYDYLVHALTAYQRGTAVANGRVNPIMQGFAGQLSAGDIQDVAAYLSGLPGKLVVQR